MNIGIEPGKYVVAVSGGVDSVVLLDILAKQTEDRRLGNEEGKSQDNLELVVAHFDHGIRIDSGQDLEFVEKLAQKYNLPFEYSEGKLGSGASEEAARKARYEFLHRVRAKHSAKAIITAHHQDDVIETMFINILRGTRHKGLVSLASDNDILRPLLEVSKKQILDYAKEHNLDWHEDSTNSDESYLRNWVRNNVVKKLSVSQREKLLVIHSKAKADNEELDLILRDLGAGSQKLDKQLLSTMPHDTASEYVAYWLRSQNVRDFDKKVIERIVIGAKTLQKNKTIEIKNGTKITIEDRVLVIKKPLVA